MSHDDASHHLEQLAEQMRPGSVCRTERHVDLPRIGLGVGNELGIVFAGTMD